VRHGGACVYPLLTLFGSALYAPSKALKVWLHVCADTSANIVALSGNQFTNRLSSALLNPKCITDSSAVFSRSLRSGQAILGSKVERFLNAKISTQVMWRVWVVLRVKTCRSRGVEGNGCINTSPQRMGWTIRTMATQLVYRIIINAIMHALQCRGRRGWPENARSFLALKVPGPGGKSMARLDHLLIFHYLPMSPPLVLKDCQCQYQNLVSAHDSVRDSKAGVGLQCAEEVEMAWTAPELLSIPPARGHSI
jgi:hypothetical protein